MFDQVENFKGAILNKRARVEEINLIISRPSPKGGSAPHRRNLIEEKMHLERAISELEVALGDEERRRAELLFRFEDLAGILGHGTMRLVAGPARRTGWRAGRGNRTDAPSLESWSAHHISLTVPG